MSRRELLLKNIKDAEDEMERAQRIGSFEDAAGTDKLVDRTAERFQDIQRKIDNAKMALREYDLSEGR